MKNIETLDERMRSVESDAIKATSISANAAESGLLKAGRSADETLKLMKEKCERVGANVESLSASVRRGGTTIRSELTMSESAAEELFGLTLTQQTRHQADMLRHWQSRGEVVLRPWIEGARERYQYPGLPDWTRAILKSDNDGHSDAALDDLFDRIDVMLSSGEYEKVDDILAAMPLEGPSLTLMMGLLSVTRPAAKYLPSRVRYFNRVYRLCNAMRRDAQTLLGGLK